MATRNYYGGTSSSLGVSTRPGTYSYAGGGTTSATVTPKRQATRANATKLIKPAAKATAIPEAPVSTTSSIPAPVSESDMKVPAHQRTAARKQTRRKNRSMSLLSSLGGG